jgi:hypothetical protein
MTDLVAEEATRNALENASEEKGKLGGNLQGLILVRDSSFL